MEQSLEAQRLPRTRVDVIQVNLGNRCNQACSHCHMEGSPTGTRDMAPATAQKIMEALRKSQVLSIEFTGGAPEMNPNLKAFIERLSESGKKLTVRTNLTILEHPSYSFYLDIYQRYGVRLVASLPSPLEEVTDQQRGKGAFRSSIRVLRKLNEMGYGTNGLQLDLAYNPVGDYLPPAERVLEKEFHDLLERQSSVHFNRLITLANCPIGRFKDLLLRQGGYQQYLRLLKESYNPRTLDRLMCRSLLSVDDEGNVYDCDFNLALGMRIMGYEKAKFWEIDLDRFASDVSLGEHCYACTAQGGSSCHGTLAEAGQESDMKEGVKRYYGGEIKETQDLKTSACCTPGDLPSYIGEVLPLIPDEVRMKYYGCGSPIPPGVDGLRVLDVGCGTGRDCFVLSRLVGEEGHVYGIDMTERQIEVAKRHVPEMTKRFGYERPNVDFILDDVENIEKNFPEESLDLIISNCVVNLVEDKERVLRQIYRAMKSGGEFYFSDIYADRRIPEGLRRDPVLYGECLGGALYYRDFERMARRVGFPDSRLVSRRTIAIQNKDVKGLVGNITFYAITYRLWKLEGPEDACEDYGHEATYKGGLKESPLRFELDRAHIFYKDKPRRVCGSTARMLSRTRFAPYFTVTGSFDEHFGEFKECSGIPGEECSKGSSCC
ncbi:MAG: arsenosugar biosynthesis radical SAM (seleno)protein ArsS [Chloroflexota bacterium]